jgi:hypothetical protein
VPIKPAFLCNGITNPATLVPGSCKYGQPGCHLEISPPGNTVCRAALSRPSQQKDSKISLWDLEAAMTKRFIKGDRYYFYYNPAANETDKTIRVGQTEVLVRLTFEKDCLPIEQKCLARTGTKQSPIELEGDDLDKEWYLEVQSFKSQYVDIQLSDTQAGSSTAILLNHEHFSSIEFLEQRTFKVEGLDKSIKEIEVKLLAPPGVLHLEVVNVDRKDRKKKGRKEVDGAEVSVSSVIVEV